MKKLLVVVDMQNDFITGPLGTNEARNIVPKVIEKVREEYKNGADIVCTRDTHDYNYLDTQEGKNLPVEHCIEKTNGWYINDELWNVLYNEIDDFELIDKPSFGYLKWPVKAVYDKSKKYYKERFEIRDDYDEIELIGVCTDICVISNAIILKAQYPETLIKVDASCCAGVTPESHKNALEAMKMCQITIVNE